MPTRDFVASSANRGAASDLLGRFLRAVVLCAVLSLIEGNTMAIQSLVIL